MACNSHSSDHQEATTGPAEMFCDEPDGLRSPPSERCVFTFPNLDFGMPAMGMAELRQALSHQLCLHSTNPANETAIDRPVPEEPWTVETFTDYQNHRLAAVSWFAHILQTEFASDESRRSVFLPCVNVMDRYLTACADLGEDPSLLWKNIGNVRAACLSLSLKMHRGETVDPVLLCQENTWVTKALSANRQGPRIHVSVLADAQGTREAEMRIICTLRGAVFPANAENTIGILCKYLILEHLGGRISGELQAGRGLDRRVTTAAAGLLSKAALDVKLPRVERWKCVAACCALSTAEMRRLERSLMALLDELKPGEFAQRELRHLKRLLTRGCVVCSGGFVNRIVHRCLLRISSLSCSACKAYPGDLAKAPAAKRTKSESRSHV